MVPGSTLESSSRSTLRAVCQLRQEEGARNRRLDVPLLLTAIGSRFRGSVAALRRGKSGPRRTTGGKGGPRNPSSFLSFASHRPWRRRPRRGAPCSSTSTRACAASPAPLWSFSPPRSCRRVSFAGCTRTPTHPQTKQKRFGRLLSRASDFDVCFRARGGQVGTYFNDHSGCWGNDVIDGKQCEGKMPRG